MDIRIMQELNDVVNSNENLQLSIAAQDAIERYDIDDDESVAYNICVSWTDREVLLIEHIVPIRSEQIYDFVNENGVEKTALTMTNEGSTLQVKE